MKKNVSDIIKSIDQELNSIENEINQDANKNTEPHQTEIPSTSLLKLNGFIANLSQYNKKLVEVLNSKHPISERMDNKTIKESLSKLQKREQMIDQVYHKVFKFAEKHDLITMEEGDHVPKIGSNPIVYKFSNNIIQAFLASKQQLENTIRAIDSNLQDLLDR